MYKIAAIVAFSTCLATSAFAAGGINEPIGGQSENPETQHNDVTAVPRHADAPTYARLHHRHSQTVDKQ
ncbi:hypothetical protein [Rhizobium sp. HT1-10]|uniref:hypothetical protein n=1 Tax=Rhizobium sp. HT1-10 TaxID=3111638 RepID=UPI003C1CF486